MPTFTMRNPAFFGTGFGDWKQLGPLGTPTPATAYSMGYPGNDGPKSGTLTMLFGFTSEVVSSGHGTFPCSSPPPGFFPTTNLRGHIQWSGSLEAGATMSRDMALTPPTTDTNPVINLVFPDFTSFLNLQVIATFSASLAMVGIFQQVYQDLGDVTITGNYEIMLYQFTMDPTDSEDVDVGDIITITSSGIDALDLTELTISLACGTVVPIIQTPNLFRFAIPAACSGAGPSTVMANGNGVQFSGSVPLGNLNILLTNASGIYTLTPGKRNDTLYSSARDGTTRDVKIPNPFAKTGFIGG